MLPQANVGDLMLDREVVEAVHRGDFHVYAVSTLRDAVETFTGKSWDEVRERVGTALRAFRAAAV